MNAVKMRGEPWGGGEEGKRVSERDSSCVCLFHLFFKELEEIYTIKCKHLCNGQVELC